LRGQTHQPDEIIVVDNSTSKASCDFLRSMPDVRVIVCDEAVGCQPLMRNLALQATSCELICFLDDDGFATPEWLERTVKLFDGQPIVGMAGRILQGGEETVRSPVPSRLFRFSPLRGAIGNFNLIHDQPLPADHAQGTNMAFRAQALRELGGWDPLLCGGYASFEEMDVCLGLRRRGGLILYHPHAIVRHGMNPRPGGVGREIGSDARYATFYSRNHTYVAAKHCRCDPRRIAVICLLAPTLNAVRCFRTARSGSVRWVFEWQRLRAAFGVMAGAVIGVIRYASARRRRVLANFPRYE